MTINRISYSEYLEARKTGKEISIKISYEEMREMFPNQESLDEVLSKSDEGKTLDEALEECNDVTCFSIMSKFVGISDQGNNASSEVAEMPQVVENLPDGGWEARYWWQE